MQREAMLARTPDAIQYYKAKYTFAQEAVKLALRMVTIQPPMVIDYPTKFCEDVHEKHSSQWRDEYQDKTDLIYFKPVLYATCEPKSQPMKKGLVGNETLFGLWC